MANKARAKERRRLANNPGVHPLEREWKQDALGTKVFGTTTTTTTTSTTTTTTTTT